MKKTRQGILFLGDIILAVIALATTVFIGFLNEASLNLFYKHILPFSILYIFWICFFYIFGLYDLKIIRPKSELLIKTIQALASSFFVGLGFFYLVPLFGITPKTNLFINIIIFGLLTFAWRKIFYILSSHKQENIGFLGQNYYSEKLEQQIQRSPQLGYKTAGFLNKEEPLQNQLKRKNIKLLVIAKELSDNVTKELYQSLHLKVSFIDLAKAYEIFLHKIPINFINQSWFLKNFANGEKKTYDKIKRLLDLFLSFLIIIITSPIWILTALLIKIEDRGSIFYKQERVGKEGMPFKIWKFRSMVENAEKNGAEWATQQDKRRTKVGRVIRRLHIDEFPQMINIIKGDISLTGPRPERPSFVSQLEKEIPHYQLRHILKPGFTGWAQTRWIQYARTKEDSHEKFQYDLYYIKNRSLLLDLGILLRTFQLFFKRG